MANIKSAQKRNRQRLRRRERNQNHLTTMRTYVKRVRVAIETKDAAKDVKATKAAKAAGPKVMLDEVLKKAIRQIDKAAQKGVLARKAASRKISRLTLAVTRAAASV